MPHDTSLITTIVAGLVLAFLLGALANRLKLPPLVGYLVAGVLVGPHSPGFVADETLAPQLAEIGVILLMFGVGLEFSLKDLLSVRAIAVPGAVLQIAAATVLGYGLATAMGFVPVGGLIFGLSLSVASTVVLLKALTERHLVDSDRGRIAVGWLIVEDLAMVLALVLIPAFAAASGGAAEAAHAAASDPFVALTEELLHTQLTVWGVLAVTIIKVAAFVGFMLVVGRRIIPWLLHATAHTGSRELFRLAVLAIALGVAAGASYLFGVSLALGAFFAGMVLSESELSHRAAQETLPLRDAFGVLFFVSVGMLFDPSIVVREPVPLVATLVIILFGKSLFGFLLLALFRQPMTTSLLISAALAQIGEFSFILAALGVTLGVLPETGRDLILAGAIISIILNPVMFWLAERWRPHAESARADNELGPVVPDSLEETTAEPELDEVQPTRQRGHVILIGYGRVGTVVATELQRERTPFLLIEDSEDRVHLAREAGVEVIVGNAATPQTLRLANAAESHCVVIAIPNAFEAGQATEQCRRLNPSVRIIARAHSDEEVEYLTRLGADEVIMGEREIGLGMIDWLNGVTRRDAAANAATRLSVSDNLLRQARAGRPAADATASPAELLGIDEPIDARRASAVPALVPRRRREPPLGRVEPSLPVIELPPPVAAPAVEPPAAARAPDAEPPPVRTRSESEPTEVATVPRFPMEASQTVIERTTAALAAETVVPAEPVAPAFAAAQPIDVVVDSAVVIHEPRVVTAPPAPEPEPEAVAAAPASDPDPVAAGPLPEREPLAAQMPPQPEPAREAPRSSPGVRVIPASEIVILPPGVDEPPVAPGHYWMQEDHVAAVEETRGEGGGTFDPGGTDPGPREASWMAGLERDLFGEVDGDPDQLAAAAVEGEPNQTPQPVPQPVEEPHPPEVPPPAPEPPPPSYPSEAPQPPQPVEVPPVIPERREAVADSDVEEFDDDGDIRKEPRLF